MEYPVCVLQDDCDEEVDDSNLEAPLLKFQRGEEVPSDFEVRYVVRELLLLAEARARKKWADPVTSPDGWVDFDVFAHFDMHARWTL